MEIYPVFPLFQASICFFMIFYPFFLAKTSPSPCKKSKQVRQPPSATPSLQRTGMFYTVSYLIFYGLSAFFLKKIKIFCQKHSLTDAIICEKQKNAETKQQQIEGFKKQ